MNARAIWVLKDMVMICKVSKLDGISMMQFLAKIGKMYTYVLSKIDKMHVYVQKFTRYVCIWKNWQDAYLSAKIEYLQRTETSSE